MDSVRAPDTSPAVAAVPEHSRRDRLLQELGPARPLDSRLRLLLVRVLDQGVALQMSLALSGGHPARVRTITYPVRLLSAIDRFLISPNSPNRSCKSSSCVSSFSPVTMMIQPSTAARELSKTPRQNKLTLLSPVVCVFRSVGPSGCCSAGHRSSTGIAYHPSQRRPCLLKVLICTIRMKVK